MNYTRLPPLMLRSHYEKDLIYMLIGFLITECVAFGFALLIRSIL